MTPGWALNSVGRPNVIAYVKAMRYTTKGNSSAKDVMKVFSLERRERNKIRMIIGTEIRAMRQQNELALPKDVSTF